MSSIKHTVVWFPAWMFVLLIKQQTLTSRRDCVFSCYIYTAQLSELRRFCSISDFGSTASPSLSAILHEMFSIVPVAQVLPTSASLLCPRSWWRWIWATSFVCMSCSWSPFDISSEKTLVECFELNKIFSQNILSLPDRHHWLLRKVAIQKIVLFYFFWAVLCWLVVQIGESTLP